MARHDLSDGQWKRVEAVLPPVSSTGRPPIDRRLILNGIVFVLKTGIPWRDLPKEFGNWSTVYERFRLWSHDGTWEKVLCDLQARRQANGEIDWDLFVIDGTVIRAHKAAAGASKKDPREPEDHALGRSKGGFGTKLHVLCDSLGWLLTVVLTPGQRHDSQALEPVMEKVSVKSVSGPNKRRPKVLAGDKGYSSGKIRGWLRRRAIRPVIAHRETEKARSGPFDRETYRRRNIVERTIGWLKEFRRIATRYEKLAKHFQSMTHIAMILQFISY